MIPPVVTPPTPPRIPLGQAQIHWIRPDAAEDCLSPEERQRAHRFRFDQDAARWIAWRSGLRRILGSELGLDAADVPLRSGPNGKPELDEPYHGLHFNLSHSRDLAVLVICRDGPVGIDLEPLDRAPSLIECAADFCHPEESAGLPVEPALRAAALLELWVAKEAVLKALGTGLGFPPHNLRIMGDRAVSNPPLPGLDALQLAKPPAPPDYQMAVTVPRGVKIFGFPDH